MPTGPSTSIALCVASYLRPVGLGRLLEAIAKLDAVPDVARVDVVVVDNDPAGSARAVVDRAPADLDVTYVCEPRRGITFARNRALATARASGSEWIGWLDDDEAPRPDWLARLFATQRLTGADVVTGPSVPTYDGDAPQWIIDAGVFEPERFVSGATYPFFHTRTSGVVLRASAAPEDGFDDRLALTGGEDRVFFTLMHRAGAAFVWDDEALVDEWVPRSRISVSWLTRRWFRTGVTRSLTLVYLDHPSTLRRARRVAGGIAMALRGVVETVVAVPSGRGAVLRSSRRILLGLGASYGALGLHFREYRRIHGQ